MVVLGMPDHRLNRRAAFEQFAQLGGEIPAACDIDCDRFGMIALPAKALIDKRFLGPNPRHTLDLGQCGFQSRSIIGIVVLGIDPDNPTLPRRGNDAHFAAKLVVLMHFAFGDTFHFRSMHTIDLAVISALLRQDPPGNPH